MWKLFPPIKRLAADRRGLASIEFAFASTALTVGLLNGLEVARWSLQRMEVANAVHSATLAVWNACDSKHVPASSNCPGRVDAYTNGLKSTSLSTNVTMASGYPTEGYYCVNGTTGVLTNVGNYDASPAPTDCKAQNNNSDSPGDYFVIQANYSYTPLVGAGLTVGSLLPATITSTGYIRLK